MTEESTNREGKKPRRGKGEGSITQRKDGTWQGMLDMGFSGGKRQRRYVYAKTKTEAGRKLRALREHMQQSAQAEDRQAEQTVAEYVTHWYRMCVEGNVAPSTQTLTFDQIEHHIIPGLGNFQLNQLQSVHIQEWVNDLRKKRCRPTFIPKGENGEPDEHLLKALAESRPFLSPRRIQIIVGVLKQALNHALENDVIPKNPAETVSLPPVPDYEPRVLSDEEVGQILQTIQEDRLKTLYHLLICLGLRRGEALNLRWKDLNLEPGKASLFIRKGKTPASRRTIPLSDELVDSLLRHREQQDQEQELFGAGWNPQKLVFPSLAGTPLSGRNVYRHYKAMLVKAGVEEKKPNNGAQTLSPKLEDDEPSVRIHDLRHWMCSYMLREGTPIREVQEIIGHATVTTTLKVYAHVIGENKRHAVSRISQLLKKSG